MTASSIFVSEVTPPLSPVSPSILLAEKKERKSQHSPRSLEHDEDLSGTAGRHASVADRPCKTEDDLESSLADSKPNVDTVTVPQRTMRDTIANAAAPWLTASYDPASPAPKQETMCTGVEQELVKQEKADSEIDRMIWEDWKIWGKTKLAESRRARLARILGVPTTLVTKRVRLLESMFPIPDESLRTSPTLTPAIALPPSPALSSANSEPGPTKASRRPRKRKADPIPISADDVFGPGTTISPALIAEASEILSAFRDAIVTDVDPSRPETYSLPLPVSQQEMTMMAELGAFTEWADRQRELVEAVERQRAIWEQDSKSISRRPPMQLLQGLGLKVKKEETVPTCTPEQLRWSLRSRGQRVENTISEQLPL